MVHYLKTDTTEDFTTRMAVLILVDPGFLTRLAVHVLTHAYLLYVKYINVSMACSTILLPIKEHPSRWNIGLRRGHMSWLELLDALR